MVRPITKDLKILQTKSEKATKDDIHIVQDLIDTAEFHKDRCCGLAAIQISEPKRIIVVRQNNTWLPLINPIVVKRSTDKYKTMEGCMSLTGEREVIRFKTVTVMYEDKYGKRNKIIFGGRVAQIVQHEIDHLNGVLI